MKSGRRGCEKTTSSSAVKRPPQAPSISLHRPPAPHVRTTVRLRITFPRSATCAEGACAGGPAGHSQPASIPAGRSGRRPRSEDRVVIRSRTGHSRPRLPTKRKGLLIEAPVKAFPPEPNTHPGSARRNPGLSRCLVTTRSRGCGALGRGGRRGKPFLVPTSVRLASGQSQAHVLTFVARSCPLEKSADQRGATRRSLSPANVLR